jgi:hypothetical protein
VNSLRILIPTICVVVGTACAGDQPSQAGSNPAPQESTSMTSSESEATFALPGAVVDRPAEWLFRQPSSSMRLAEAEIPGDAGAALLTVFFFGPGGGGGVEANLNRWASQIESEPGVEAIRDSFSVGDFTVSTIAVEGTILPSRMGGGPSEPTPGSALLGAVIEGPGGPWFFKVTGPKDTVSAAAPAFDQMLRSIRL